MLNQTLLIGRIVAEPELRETSTGKKVTSIRLAVPRSYRNEEGVHEADFIECSMWNNKAERASDYLKTGDLVLVSARVQTYTNEKTKFGHVVNVAYLDDQTYDEKLIIELDIIFEG